MTLGLITIAAMAAGSVAASLLCGVWDRLRPTPAARPSTWNGDHLDNVTTFCIITAEISEKW
jgi:hypothetical protein